MGEGVLVLNPTGALPLNYIPTFIRRQGLVKLPEAGLESVILLPPLLVPGITTGMCHHTQDIWQ